MPIHDLTVLYYTANLISDHFAETVRAKHREAIPTGISVISVSHRPIDFGRNIVVSLPVCTYSVYRQILIAAHGAATKYVACIEDDTLYPVDHFLHRPEPGEFLYNMNRWWIEREGVYRYRNRTGMCTCIVETELLVDVLEVRFRKYPHIITDRKALTGWGEPGRYEGNLGLPQVKRAEFRSQFPVVTFNHRPSLGGVRRRNETDRYAAYLEPWGNAVNLWREIHA